jgi:(p)ppGpp synthase/HD superfamily hydrolase
MTNSLLNLAREKCKEWHKGQQRKYTGEPYHVHPFEVAHILKERGMSEDTQIAGLLHDTIEDCNVTKNQIAKLFGDRIADLVNMVTDVSTLTDGNRKIRKAIDRDHVAKADAEGQTIKLADLISNTRSIVEHDPGFAKVYMAEKKELLTVLTKGDKELYKRAKALLDQYYSSK